MPDGWQLWLDWHKVVAPDNQSEIEALEADRGKFLGTFASWVGDKAVLS